MTVSGLFTAGLLAAVCLSAQVTAGSGHWEGTIRLPDKQLAIEVDLLKKDHGDWMGAINVPEQNLKAYPLANIDVKARAITFAIKGIPGDPTFQGNLSEDGQALSGDFTQSGANFTFELKRSGEAKLETPPKSTPLTREFAGSWEGTLEAGDKKLRLRFKLSNQADGTAQGTLVSVDQGGLEIPVATVTQTGMKLQLDVRAVNGAYKGELKKEAGEIAGEWTQNGATYPLTLKRMKQ